MRKGVPQIKIPIRPDAVSIEAIEPYIDEVFSQFAKNAEQIRRDYDFYCLNHPIYAKERVHHDTDTNNIVLIPDLKSKIDWKTGYVFGNPIKYTQSKSNETDDISYLHKWSRSVCQRAVDSEVGTWMYATGVGYYFVEPRSDIFDVETEAPYVLYRVDSDTCAKVYSAFLGNAPLFDLIYTTYNELVDGVKREVKVLDIYLESELHTYENRGGVPRWERVSTKSRGLAKPLPLVEKRYGMNAIGIVAMGESMQRAIDLIVSNGLDNIEDVVNQVIVYMNSSLGDDEQEQAETHRSAMKNGCIVLNSSSTDFPADVKTLERNLNIGDVKELFAIINEKFHSTIGVPLAMSSTNSGGTTKSGSEVANGYDNAYNRALDDINAFIKADTELLNKIMWICKNTPNNSIDNLSASDIEIKYSLNLTDNILTKTQSYVNLVQTGVPPTIALRLCKLSNDPEAEGKLIEDYAKEKMAQEQKQTPPIPNNNSQE